MFLLLCQEPNGEYHIVDYISPYGGKHAICGRNYSKQESLTLNTISLDQVIPGICSTCYQYCQNQRTADYEESFRFNDEFHWQLQEKYKGAKSGHKEKFMWALENRSRWFKLNKLLIQHRNRK